MKRTVKLRNQIVEVDLENDFYGSNFWNRIEVRKYEPDTISFIEDRADMNTDFLDIGAANGAMSLIAASMGARVFSYEPDPRIYEVIARNVRLNPNLSISLANKAISNQSANLIFGSRKNQDVISEIVLTGHQTTMTQQIEVLSLADELRIIHVNAKRKLIIKMDIEGAEWKILRDEATISALSEHSAELLLAVHPGFHRPFKPQIKGLDKIRVAFWHLQNRRDSKDLFKKLTKVAKIYRTNLNPIVSPKQFSFLIFAGYHEFIIDFSQGL